MLPIFLSLVCSSLSLLFSGCKGALLACTITFNFKARHGKQSSEKVGALPDLCSPHPREQTSKYVSLAKTMSRGYDKQQGKLDKLAFGFPSFIIEDDMK